jgi:hypothetical protein
MLQYQRLSSPTYSQQAQMVSLADMRTLQYHGNIQFTLPSLPNNTLTAKVSSIIDNPERGFSWMGNLVSGGQGYVIFNIKDGKKSAIIMINGAYYEVIPLTEEYQALVKKKNADIGHCGLGPSPELGIPPDITGPGGGDPGGDPTGDCTPTDNNNACPALIEVLIIVEPEAKVEIEALYGSISTFLNNSDNIINMAFANSDIPNKEIYTKWIVDEDFGGLLSSSTEDDMDWLITFDSLKVYRSTYNADLVVLLTTDRYPSIFGSVNAIGPGFDNAFAIVEYPAFYSSQVFGHELGHLFGARHGWDNDPAEVCAHAYVGSEEDPPSFPGGPYQGYFWRTITSAISDELTVEYQDPQGNWHVFDNQGVIPHYSNPEISYGGLLTGSPKHNNAEQIRNATCEVAGYVASPTLRFSISSAINCESSFFRANVVSPQTGFSGQPPYAYTWHWSLDGIFNQSTQTTNYLGTTSNNSITIPTPNCAFYYLRCMVSALDGTTVTRIIFVDLTKFDCPCVEFIPSATTDLLDDTNTQFHINPNPSSGYIQLTSNISETQNVKYIVSNTNGNVILSGDLQQGRSIAIESLLSGMYRITLVTDKQTQSRSFFKL